MDVLSQPPLGRSRSSGFGGAGVFCFLERKEGVIVREWSQKTEQWRTSEVV